NPGDSVPPSTVAAVPSNVDQGALFSRLLAPAPPSGQTLSQTVDVPAGTNFELTDFALQNPDQDSGVAVLSNGTNVIYTLSLADVNTGDKRVSLVSPIEVVGGTQLVLQLSCVGAGNISGVCTAAMLVSGRMVPAPPAAPAG
ncbi:MAG TPA: hypothetical protein VIH06_06625, partial [Ilumatobacteraceae bacterium]